MNSPTGKRILAVVLILGSFVAFFVLDSSEVDNVKEEEAVDTDQPLPVVEKRLQLVASRQCRECHPEVYDEWKGSHHAFAWLNPEPRRPELSDNFKNKDCIPCHAPRPMLEVGFGVRPLEREDRREEGVNCFTCHRYGNGNMAANDLGPSAAGAPCNPRTWRPVASMTLCAPCHDQHKVKQDWLRSRFAVEGDDYMDCNDCHMPVAPGPGTVGGSRKTHRHHGFPGAHDPAMLKTAAVVRAELVDRGQSLNAAVSSLSGRDWSPDDESDKADTRRLLIEVKNTGTGHNFPSDERHRAADLTIQRIAADGTRGEEMRLTRFRNPYRHEFEITNPFKYAAGKVLTNASEWDGSSLAVSQVRLLPEFNPNRKVFYEESTQLHSGESRLLFFDVDGDSGERLHLRLYYKLNPYMSENDAVIVSETTIDL